MCLLMNHFEKNLSPSSEDFGYVFFGSVKESYYSVFQSFV